MTSSFLKKVPDTLAFGIIPALRKYELYYARFHQMVPVFAEVVEKRGAEVQVLDVGSGHGEAKQFADTVAPGLRWTAVEIDPSRAAECMRLGYSDVLSNVDLERDAIPATDGSFDVVIANHVLEHIADAGQFLRECYRVLKPGGVLLIGVPMHLGPVAALARLRYRIRGRRPRGHCHFFSMRSLRRFLDGFPVRDIWGFRIFSARRQLPLEDHEWFYRASQWLGKRIPWLTTEVIVDIRKPLNAS